VTPEFTLQPSVQHRVVLRVFLVVGFYFAYSLSVKHHHRIPFPFPFHLVVDEVVEVCRRFDI